MATATGWIDYAILEPSKPAFNKKGEPVKWKVQRNEAGDWRCHCPGFIFSGKGGAVRTCKHIRFCQSAWQLEQGIALTNVNTSSALVKSHVAKAMATLPVTATISPVAPVLLAEAKQIFAAMVAAAQIKVSHNLLNHIGRDSCQHMTEALRLKLVAFNPAAVARADTAATATTIVAVGVRHITFDDE